MRSRQIYTFVALAALLPLAATTQSLLQKAAKVAETRTNPYAHDESSVAAGEKLFERECAACHGEGGTGNGRAHTPPLATPFIRQADPGTLFWILRNGSATHRMPSFSHLPEQQRWQIISYLQRR